MEETRNTMQRLEQAQRLGIAFDPSIDYTKRKDRRIAERRAAKVAKRMKRLKPKRTDCMHDPASLCHKIEDAKERLRAGSEAEDHSPYPPIVHPDQARHWKTCPLSEDECRECQIIQGFCFTQGAFITRKTSL